MTNCRWLRPALICGLLAASSAANAGFILGNPGAPSTTIQANNDFASDLAALGITSFTLGTSLELTAPANLTFELWGSEAGYNNTLVVGSSVLLNTTGVAREVWGNVQSATWGFGGGTLGLSFCALDISMCLSNGNNPASSGFQSIGMWVDPNNASSAWLLWDDSGAGPDDNHDDMIVRVTATQVPEPSAMALLALGLASFGFFTLRDRIRRRRRTIELRTGELSRRFR